MAFPPPLDTLPPCSAKKCERVGERQSKEGMWLGTELYCLRGRKGRKKKKEGESDLMSSEQKRPGERN